MNGQNLMNTVHPHGCGERLVSRHLSIHGCGSSPRVWGTPRGINRLRTVDRFIPTGVGNAVKKVINYLLDTVHPHGCGERHTGVFIRARNSGSSPRVWGTRDCRSYRYRGNRFIPTGVGNALSCKFIGGICAVHPHGWGERKGLAEAMRQLYGSSPRVWGTPGHIDRPETEARFIPTGVGNAAPKALIYKG